jgi:hypothetical protein
MVSALGEKLVHANPLVGVKRLLRVRACAAGSAGVVFRDEARALETRLLGTADHEGGVQDAGTKSGQSALLSEKT